MTISESVAAVERVADGLGVLSSFPSSNSWPELDARAYHGLAGEFVELVEPHSEADPAALLLQFLVAAGCAIGRGPHVEVEATQHGLNENVCAVGDTASGRKGTSLEHVRKVIAAADPAFAEFRIKGGLSSGEGLAFEVRDPVHRENDVGVEECIDEGVTDKRLLVIEPEFAQVLKVATRQGNTLATVMRDAWDGRTLSPMTKNNRVTATGPHIAVIGHVTQAELLRHLTETDAASGFGNRFLWILSKRSKLLPRGGRVPEDEFRRFAARLAGVLARARQVGRIERTEAAWQAWERVYEPLTTGKAGLLGAITARGAAHVVRLSAIYSALDATADIQPEHLAAALAVWSYSEESAGYIFGERLGDPDADRVLETLKATGPEGMTRTEISGLFGRNRDAATLHRVLTTLDAAGLASCIRLETGGRPVERWIHAKYETNEIRGKKGA